MDSTIVPHPAVELTWDPDKKEWKLSGLCDACRQPCQGGPKKVSVKVFEGPMMFRMESLTVCTDQLACQSAFRDLLNTNARLRSQRGVSF